MEARISRESALLRIAGIFAERSTCQRKKAGCVITQDHRVVASGYNGSPAGLPHCIDDDCLIDEQTGGCIRTVHAEAAAISFAARAGVRLEGSRLYTTLAPCLPCAKLIINAGIREVYYTEAYRDRRGVELLQSTDGIFITPGEVF